MDIGKVQLTYSNGMTKVDKLSMLLLPKAKLSLEYDDITSTIKMLVEDTDVQYQQLQGELDLETIKDLMRGLQLIAKNLQ